MLTSFGRAIKRVNVVSLAAGLVAFAIVCHAHADAQDQDEPTAVKQTFETNCAACHGSGGAGGERAPALNGNPDLRKRSPPEIENIIRQGTSGGMPAFSSLPASDVAALAGWIHSMNLSALSNAPLEQIRAGQQFFFGEGACSSCHMVHGRGAVNGPDLTNIAARSTLPEIEKVLDDPASQMGIHSLALCPPWAFCPDFSWAVLDVTLKNGTVLRGFGRKRTEHELQLQSFDGKLHLLDAGEYTLIRQEKTSSMPPLKATPAQRQDLLAYLSSLGGIEAGPVSGPVPPVSLADLNTVLKPTSGAWPTYNGLLNGNRYSSLDQINTSNVRQLQPQFTFSPGGTGLEVTPVVVDGVMYVTGAAQTCAINARTGSSIWCTPRTNGLGSGVSSEQKSEAKTATPKGPNRGVALLGDRVFYVSDDAFMVCLNRLTGAVMWSQPLQEAGANGKYYTSSAPLVAGDLVISGVAGETRHCAASSRPITPPRASWPGAFTPSLNPASIQPKPGPGALCPRAAAVPGRPVLMMSRRARSIGRLAIPIPTPILTNASGSNLYTNSVLALDGATGKLKWHFQFTPMTRMTGTRPSLSCWWIPPGMASRANC